MSENPHAGQGMVVLDIGGDIGALVITAPATMAGVEIEICPAGTRHRTPDEGAGWWPGSWRGHPHDHAADQPVHHHSPDPAWPHVAVLPRATPGGVGYAAVYPGLRVGRYEVWARPDGPTALTITVVGGHVATAAWSDHPESRQRPEHTDQPGGATARAR